jgi:hypothetical protein
MLWFLRKQLKRSDISVVLVVPSSSLSQLLAPFLPLTVASQVFTQEPSDAQYKQLSTADASGARLWKELLLTVAEKLSTQEAVKIVPALTTQLDNSLAMIFAAEAVVQTGIQALGWDGALVPANCPLPFSLQNCTVSTFLWSEHNIGKTLTSTDVERSFAHEVRLLPGKTTQKRTVVLNHQGVGSVWPEGRYEALIRAALDESASRLVVAIDGQVLDQSSVGVQPQQDLQIVSFPVDLEPGESKTVTITYETQSVTATNGAFVFAELVQPGMGEGSFQLSVVADTSFTPITVAPNAQVNKNILRFSTLHESRKLFAVGF